jgi:hypothetical protein
MVAIRLPGSDFWFHHLACAALCGRVGKGSGLTAGSNDAQFRTNWSGEPKSTTATNASLSKATQPRRTAMSLCHCNQQFAFRRSSPMQILIVGAVVARIVSIQV